MRTTILAFALSLAACSGARPAAESPASDAPPEAAPVVLVQSPAPDPAAEAAPLRTPAELYGNCRERVEGPSTDGECTVDADCVRTGCSSEVCVPAAKAGDVMSTCEVLPCFAALDTCGCHEGQCSWTLKASVPPLGKLPPPVQ